MVTGIGPEKRTSEAFMNTRPGLDHTDPFWLSSTTRFRSDERIHLLLNFLFQISTCPIEAEEAGSLDHEITCSE
jgi:hypothetical protein